MIGRFQRSPLTSTIGRYRIIEKVGQGGMGVVYRAHDTLLERVVALKIISTSIEDNPDLRERFFREARAAGQLSHRNIITIHDLGEHEGQPFLSMEFLNGEDLQHRLARQEAMSLRRKLEIASEICDGLSYAHRRGLVHRDVKPANIFITDDGVVKLLDFGLARMVTSELTRSNMMMGTLNYMSPEQVRGERTDHRADIFSFGVVLYEMLSGRKAFQGDSFATTLYKILQDVPEPLHNIDSTIPEEVVWLVEKALAKPKDERYQELTDVSRDLAVIRQHLSGGDAVTTASTVFTPQRSPSDPPRSSGSGQRRLYETVAGGPASPPPVTPSDRPITAVQPTARRWGFAGGVLGILALGAIGAWLALREPPGANRAPEQPSQGQPAAVTQPAPNPQPPEAPTPQAQQPQPLPAPPVREVPPPATEGVTTPQAARSAATEARGRMSRAKNAARQAGSVATSSGSYAAASAAEREGQRLYQSGLFAEAAAKFYEASGLFRSAELTPAPAPASAPPPAAQPPLQRPETKPQTAAPQPSAPATQAPVPAPTPTVPRAEGQVELPTVPAPRAPTPPPPAPRTEKPAAISAAEGGASPGAEEAIRDLVRRYAQALEARSIDAVKRLWPSLQGAQEDAVRKEFMHARQIAVDVDDTNVNVSGNTGTVTFVRRYRLSTVDGQRLDTNSRTTMSVRRAGNEWVIDRVRFEALR
jgi:serine/threonine-protein kinase